MCSLRTRAQGLCPSGLLWGRDWNPAMVPVYELWEDAPTVLLGRIFAVAYLLLPHLGEWTKPALSQMMSVTTYCILPQGNVCVRLRALPSSADVQIKHTGWKEPGLGIKRGETWGALVASYEAFGNLLLLWASVSPLVNLRSRLNSGRCRAAATSALDKQVKVLYRSQK